MAQINQIGFENPVPDSQVMRQQAIAKMLREQASQPIDTNQVAGGYVVPVSPLQNIAKIAQTLIAKNAENKADEAMTGYQNKQKDAYNNDIRGMTEAMNEVKLDDFKADRFDENDNPFGQMQTSTPAPNRNKAMAIALQSGNPSLRGMGVSMLADSMADEAYTLGPGQARFKGGQEIASSPIAPESIAKPSSVRELEAYLSLPPDQQKIMMDLKRAQQVINLGGSQAVLGTGGGIREQYAVTPKPEQMPEFVGQQASAQATAKAEAGAMAEQKKAEARAGKMIDIIGEARTLLPKATGSILGTGLAKAKGMLGISDESTQANERLRLLSGWATSNVPRMEGPQSEADRLGYIEMAGKIGDSTKPIKDRLAALSQLEVIQKRQDALKKGRVTPQAATYVKTGSDKLGRKFGMRADGTIEFMLMLNDLEKKYGLPPGMLAAVRKAESGGNPKAVSPKGALGAFQIMPETARELGVDPLDEAQAAEGAARYLAQNIKKFGTPELALAAYNAGPGNVQKHGGIPPFKETRNYVKKVSADMKNQKIDPSTITWDDEKIDPSTITWDEPKNSVSDPTEGMGDFQKFAAGAGKALIDTGRGAGQLLRKVLPESASNAIGLPTQADIDEAKKRDAPLMKTMAGMLGNIGGQVLTTIPTAFIPGVNTIKGGALIGSILAAMQPEASGESRGQNMVAGAAGGAAGSAIAKTVGRIVRPVRSNLENITKLEDGSVLPENLSRLADMAENQFNIPLTPAQKTGSRPLKIIDSVLDNLPLSSSRQMAGKQAQRRNYNRAILKQVGEDTDLATPEVMNTARTRISKQFEDISGRNSVELGDDFVETLAGIDSTRTPFSSLQINSVIENALDLASKGKISGAEYQRVRTSLNNASKGAWASDPEKGRAIKAVREALDRAADKSISEADRAAWQTARAQWQNLKAIEEAAKPVSADAVAGNISPAKLASALMKSNRNGMIYGQGDQTMPDLARIGQAFIKDQIPDSGTAQRAMYQALLTGSPASIGLMTANPALMGAAAGTLALPVVLQRAIHSGAGKAYLSKGLIPDNQKTRQIARLLTAGSAASGSALANRSE